MFRFSWCARKSAADTFDLAVSVEQVVGVERNDLSFRREEVDATALYAAQVKVVAIHELDNGHAKHVLVAQVLRCGELRQTAKKAGQLVGVFAKRAEREQVGEFLADAGEIGRASCREGLGQYV